MTTVLDLFEQHRLVVEGSGALAVGGLLKRQAGRHADGHAHQPLGTGCTSRPATRSPVLRAACSDRVASMGRLE